MSVGKKKCELLKNIRKEIALRYDISYTSDECSFKGECKGGVGGHGASHAVPCRNADGAQLVGKSRARGRTSNKRCGKLVAASCVYGDGSFLRAARKKRWKYHNCRQK